ncbi:peptidoglycan-binding protein [Kitasatospora camelliae]|uniref:peptidoglycan-binding protein n=1 Tax=Kitasatospora camelliae TaxID=3156397 RepID=UPI003B587F4B
MGRRLVEEGCGKYQSGPGPQWSETDRASYQAWQEKLGYSGADADGWPGEGSWNRLRVPKVTPLTTSRFRGLPGSRATRTVRS